MSLDKPSLSTVWHHYGGELRSGRREQATRCVVHEDRSPSCSVNLEEGVWHCHACGEGGDVFTLIELKESCESFKAVLAAAERITGESYDGVRGSDIEGQRSIGISGRQGPVSRRGSTAVRGRPLSGAGA